MLSHPTSHFPCAKPTSVRHRAGLLYFDETSSAQLRACPMLLPAPPLPLTGHQERLLAVTPAQITLSSSLLREAARFSGALATIRLR